MHGLQRPAVVITQTLFDTRVGVDFVRDNNITIIACIFCVESIVQKVKNSGSCEKGRLRKLG